MKKKSGRGGEILALSSRMAVAMDEVFAGNLGVQAPLDEKDLGTEQGRVVRKFNAMLRHLQAHALDREETIHRLRDTVAAKKQDIGTLFAVSRILSSVHKIEPLLQSIIEIASPVIQAEGGVIWLVDQSSFLKCRDAHGCGDEACPSYASEDRRCWGTAGTHCFQSGHGASSDESSLESKVAGCLSCPVLSNVRLNLRVAAGLVDNAHKPETLALGDSLCREVTAHRPPVLVLHVFPDDNGGQSCYRQATWLSEERPLEKPTLIPGNSCFPEPVPVPMTRIGLALVTKNQILGIMCLGLDRIHYFTQDEVTLLAHVASLSAVAIENAELFALAERRRHQVEVLLHEAHHRIKNNLQAMAGLAALQLAENNDPEVRRLLADNLTRLRSIALVHQLLTQEDVRSVSLKAIAARVVRMVAEVTVQDAGALTVNVSGGDVEIPSRLATSVALVLNELTVNSIKHGFEEQGAGEISVEIRNGKERIHVTFGDNGKGLPPFFELARDHGLGLQIVGNLIRDDLNGTFSLKPNGGKGAVAEITFASAAPSWPPARAAASSPAGNRPALASS
ncbi:MAG: hypothetical protein A2V83_11255 [Nitrospirae bacterium RBG_16_64_22]|nr:MAG: hypothetical protein A2V83_11255 [Nitrospirae bacterium RBG_16_64_22]